MRRPLVLLILSLGWSTVAHAFELTGPGVDPATVRVTTFAEGLNFPVGMAALDDGSILVGVSNGTSFFSSNSGSILRLADTDDDGVADVQQTLADRVPGGRISALARAGDLVAITGQGSGVPITFWRLGAAASDPLQFLGRMDLNYPSGGWLHPHSSLLLREAAGSPGSFELYFQLGSDTNFAETRRTVALTSSLGLSATLAGDALHRVTLSLDGSSLSASNHSQIATGLRNATGMAFHPVTGDLYLGDNGIDGVVDANEPTSPDEINLIAAADLGGDVEDFGFPATYQEYRTGVDVGSDGVAPLVNFQPLPSPNGAEGEGLNEIVFAPSLLRGPLAGRLFVGMHGKFSLGGVANEENPLVVVDPETGDYFHLIQNTEPDVGHLDGFLSTANTLYASDISPGGGLGSSDANSGRIYAFRSVFDPADLNADGLVDAADYTLWRDTLGEAGLSPAGDADGDFRVTAADYAIWASGYGAGPAAVPEPSALALLAAAVFSLKNRGRFGEKG